MSTRKRLIFVVTALVLMGGAILLLPRGRWSKVAATDSEAQRRGDDETAPVSPRAERRLITVEAAKSPDRDVQDASGNSALKMFREWSKYPPNSRPLTEGQTDLTEPHVVAVSPLRLMAKTSDGKTRPTDHFCVLQPLRHTIMESEHQTVTLSCTKGRQMEDNPIDVPVTVTDVQLRGHNSQRGEWKVPVTTVFNDSGQDGDVAGGDLVYTIRVTPRPGDWGDMLLSVGARISTEGTDAPPTSHLLSAMFTAGGKSPARFTGKIKERMVEGSLVADAEIEVKKAGQFRVMANLFQGDRPVAYAKNDLVLAEGLQNVPLLFFGKIFHDQDAQGSFRLVDLRGHRLNFGLTAEDMRRPPQEVAGLLASMTAPNAPDYEAIAPAPAEHTTQTYNRNQFSDNEWESEYKSNRTAELTKLATQGEGDLANLP